MIATDASKSSRSRCTRVVCAGQSSPAPLLQAAGDNQHQRARADQLRDRGETPHASRCPPSASPRSGRRAVHGPSGRRRSSPARPAAPPGDVRLGGGGEARSDRSLPTAGAERAAGTARAMRRPRESCATTPSAFPQRRPEAEGGAQNLHEHAVRNAVAVRPAPRLQHAHIGGVGETLLQLVQQPALACARLADHRDCRSPTARGAGDMRFEHRQLGLAANVGRESGPARRLEPRRNPRLPKNPERRRLDQPASRAPPERMAPCACTDRRARCVSGLTNTVVGVGERGQSRRQRRRRADDVVAPRSFVQTSGDHRPDVQPRLDAQPDA